jgi:hypothetical protein
VGVFFFHFFFSFLFVVIANLWLLFHSFDESKHGRHLFIAYASAFEIWDCTDLKSLREVLNINTDHNPAVDGATVVLQWTGRVVHAAVVPEPRSKGAGVPFRGDRPLIGVL